MLQKKFYNENPLANNFDNENALTNDFYYENTLGNNFDNENPLANDYFDFENT